jgi:hypothetical protein
LQVSTPYSWCSTGGTIGDRTPGRIIGSSEI